MPNAERRTETNEPPRALEDVSIRGRHGAVLRLLGMPAARGLPASSVVELRVGEMTSHAVFDAGVVAQVAAHAQRLVAREAAARVVVEVAANTVSREWLAAQLAGLGPLGPQELDLLRDMFLGWRVQAATAVFQAVCDALPPLPVPDPAPHVAIAPANADDQVVRSRPPLRQLVRYGQEVAEPGWQSAVLLAPPRTPEELRWLEEQALPRLGHYGTGVRLDGPTPPGPGQNPDHVYIAWNAEDLDAIAAELGPSVWLTLWGGSCTGAILTKVVTYGRPRTEEQERWYRHTIRVRAMSPHEERPRPAPRAMPAGSEAPLPPRV